MPWTRQSMGERGILSTPSGANAGLWTKSEERWEEPALPEVDERIVEKCRGQVYVGGSSQLSKEEIERHLTAEYGPVIDVTVAPSETRWGHGYAFASFGSIHDAQRCLRSGSASIEGVRVRFALTATDTKHDLVSEESLRDFNDTNVFLGGTRHLREDKLIAALSVYGQVASLNLVTKPGDMLTSAGFGFVKFSSVEEAKLLLRHGVVWIEGVHVDARRGDVRPFVSDKVSLPETTELIAALEEEIEITRRFAPGGHVIEDEMRNEGVVVGLGTQWECMIDQSIQERMVPLSYDGYSIDDLGRALQDAHALKIKVEDCLNARARAAASQGNVSLLLHLIELGCDIDAPERAQAMAGEHSFGSYDPLTPRCLYLAAARGHTDVCKLVVEKGADVDAVCISEELKEIFQFVYFTPLKAAAERGHVEAVKALLSCGASPNALDHRNWTCLHWAACNNHVEVLKELAAAGGDVGARDTKGNTALHLAVTAGALHAAVALVEELGADPHALNNKEESPLPGLKELLMPQVVSAGGQNLQGAVGEGDAAKAANGGPHGASPAPVAAPC